LPICFTSFVLRKEKPAKSASSDARVRKQPQQIQGILAPRPGNSDPANRESVLQLFCA